MISIAPGVCWTDEGYRAPREQIAPWRPPLAPAMGHSFDDDRDGSAGLRCMNCSQSYHAHQDHPSACPFPRADLTRDAVARRRALRAAQSDEARARENAVRRAKHRRLRGADRERYVERELERWRAQHEYA